MAECEAMAAILPAVKRKLAITWEDEGTDARLREDLIPDAIASLTELLGLPDDYDFSEHGRERVLLLALCFYLWNDAEDQFEVNYRSDILFVQDKWRGVAYAAEEKASADIP